MVHEQLLTNKYLSINKIRLRDKIQENAKFLRCLFRVPASESTIWCLKSGTRSKYPGSTAGGTGTERLVKFQISSRRNRYAYINILCGRTTREIGTRAPSRLRLINFIFLCHPFSSNRAEGSAHRCLCATYDNILPQKMIYILRWKSIGVCFIVGLMIWNTVFSSASFIPFFLFHYENRIRSIWKVIQFFPSAKRYL